MISGQEHINWLLTCPCGDSNFKCHLKQALTKNIEDIIKTLPEKGNKSKISALKRELKKRERESEVSE